jgi:hypothetical protein
MLVNIACLKGNSEELNRAKLLGEFREIDVTNTDPIIAKITEIYKHPDSPYPRLGTVKATLDGFIVPQIGDCFFWVTIDQGGPIILEDFGSGNDRLDRFNSICRQQMSRGASIWAFAELWNQSHHKSSIERLVSYYVHNVTSQMSVSAYASWLGGRGNFVRLPEDHSKEDTYCVGIDMSFLDNSSNLVGLLENHICNKVFKGDLSKNDQRFIHKFVVKFVLYKSIDTKAIVSKNDGITESRFETLCRDITNMYNKIASNEKWKAEFSANKRNIK